MILTCESAECLREPRPEWTPRRDLVVEIVFFAATWASVEFRCKDAAVHMMRMNLGATA